MISEHFFVSDERKKRVMTWKEFKEAMDSVVSDEDLEIAYIDIKSSQARAKRIMISVDKDDDDIERIHISD